MESWHLNTFVACDGRLSRWGTRAVPHHYYRERVMGTGSQLVFSENLVREDDTSEPP
jgi:hypothetical protein